MPLTRTPFCRLAAVAIVCCLLPGQPLRANDSGPILLDGQMHHLRSGREREWTEFPEQAEGSRLEVAFESSAGGGPAVLELRQQDVRRTWKLTLNEQAIGSLIVDENDMRVYLPLPAGAVRDGRNVLTVTGAAAESDDIRVGEVRLWRRTLEDVLGECTLDVEVTEADSGGPLPCRLTLVTESGALQPVGNSSDDRIAVRSGCIYTVDGRARLRVPAGDYLVYAGRGFEYSLARRRVRAERGGVHSIRLQIGREAPTPGYVACDTHVHTLTHSGHGDATINERMITLAGEGIELPIATDHNVQIDYEPIARRLGVRGAFTPVAGNEVTTKKGHFNIFPVLPDALPPDATRADWSATFDAIYAAPGVRAVILNHARDLHAGTRPFDPRQHLGPVGVNVDGWPIRFHAMEIINSGATQNDLLQLCRDWMGLLNHGHQITPVGSSDSHDVLRHFVGQGRTYIRVDDSDPGAINVEQAIESFLAGRVLVSYGLLVDLRVNETAQPGDLATATGKSLSVTARVLAPGWITPRKLLLFANGVVVKEVEIPPQAPEAAGQPWAWELRESLPRPSHDQFLVAVAIGDGVDGPWWRTAKPYQSRSADWTPHTFACTGAVRMDVDGDGQWTSARGYAERLVAAVGDDLPRLLTGLADFDQAVSAQAAHLWRESGRAMEGAEFEAALKSAAPAVRAGFEQYRDAWREHEIAAAER